MLGHLLILARSTVVLVLGLILVSIVGLAALVQLARHEGYAPYAIHGGSMEPAISLGALVLVEPVDPALVAPGDVITIRANGGSIFTHRVVAVDDSGAPRLFQTRGDANATPDPHPVPATAVVGRVAFSIPVAGFLMAMLELRSGMVCILSLLGALLLLFWLLDDLVPRPAGTVRTVAVPEPNPART